MLNSSQIKTHIATGIIKSRVIILLCFVAIIAAALYFLQNFRIDASAETLLVKNNKLFIQSQLVTQQFSPDEFILLAYSPKNHALLSEQTFEDINSLANNLSKMDRVKQVTSILSVPLLDSSTNLVTAEVAKLTWREQRYTPERMQALLENHPIYTDLLINGQQTATALQITFKSNSQLDDINREILSIQQHSLKRELTQSEQAKIDALQKQADPIKQQLNKTRNAEIEEIQTIANEISNASMYMGGSYVVGYHLVNIIKHDLQIFGAAITAVIALLLVLIYRSFTWFVFPVFICAVSALITIGLFGMLDMRTTVISANFIALQLILTLAVMIHLIGTYRKVHSEQAQSQGQNNHQQHLVQGMLEGKLAPCFYATVTTSVGFGSLLLSGLQPVVDFGLMMMCAMLVTMAVSLLLFPAMLSFLPVQKQAKDWHVVQFIMDGFYKLSSSKPKLTVVSVLVAFGVLALGIPKLSVENSFINYFSKDTQIHSELAFIDTQFGGSTPLDVILTLNGSEEENTKKKDLAMTAEEVNQIAAVQAVLDAFDAIGSTTSVVNFTELAKQVNDGKPLTEYELNAVYTILDSDIREQLLGAYLDIESQPNTTTARISTRVKDSLEGLDRAEMLASIENDIQLAGVDADAFQLTNLFVLYQDILSRLFDSQIKTLGFVYLALAVVLVIIFKSVKIALIALVPNIATTLGILGMIGWLGIPLDVMTITIAAIAMGIAMDDTIHFVDNVLSSKNKDALSDAFHDSGMAILYTSLIIAVGFALFGFSDFLPSVYFGLLTASAMLFALLADITLLPALLKKWIIKKEMDK